MRKHSVRKWIHAILDLLPLLVIPIFAINIINRSVEPLTIHTGGYIYTPMYETNDVVYNNGVIDNDTFIEGNIYYCTFPSSVTSSKNIATFIENADPCIFIEDVGFYWTTYSSNMNIRYSLSRYNYADGRNTVGVLNPYVSFRCLDKSVLLSDFYTYCVLSKYDESKISYVETYVEDVVYNDTDIGSQFVYSLYHVTDQYFNMDDTFNMGAVYQWFSANVFGGNPPLAVPIVWHVIVYEFIMDLLFLLYAVFMFLIDFCESFMERLFDKARNGGK